MYKYIFVLFANLVCNQYELSADQSESEFEPVYDLRFWFVRVFKFVEAILWIIFTKFVKILRWVTILIIYFFVPHLLEVRKGFRLSILDLLKRFVIFSFSATFFWGASSLLRDFSPRRRPSDDSQTEDDTEIRFQLPSKKFKLENSPSWLTFFIFCVSKKKLFNIHFSSILASKPFPKYENHLELIQSKAESAKLQNKINGLERELIELKTDFDKERDGLLRDKTVKVKKHWCSIQFLINFNFFFYQKLESRINVLERELTFLSAKESEARKQLEILIKDKETENSFSNEKYKMLKEQKVRLETNLAEVIQKNERFLANLYLSLVFRRPKRLNVAFNLFG